MLYQPPYVEGATPAVAGIHNADANAAYSNGNALTGTEGSYVPAEAVEHTQREIMAIIIAAGMTGSISDLSQAAKAVQSGALISATATGTAAALTVTLDPVPTGLPKLLLIKAPLASTGATTIAVNGIAAVPIKRADGSAIQAGDYLSGASLLLGFDGVNYRLLAGGVDSVGSGIVFAGLDTGTANAHVVGQDGTLPVPTALVNGIIVRYSPAATNTGAVTVNAFGLGVKSIVDWKGVALTAGEFGAGRPTELIYSTALGKFVMLPWAQGRAKFATLTGTITSVANTNVACSNLAGASNLPNSTVNGSGVTIGAGDEGLYVLSAGLQPGVNGASLGVTILASGVGSWNAYDTSSAATAIAVSTTGIASLAVGSVVTLQGVLSVGGNAMNCSLSMVRIGGR